MLSNTWENDDRKMLILDEQWAIRQNTFEDYLSVLIHKCKRGRIGFVHDLDRQDSCDACHELVPDYAQALWYLSNWNRRDV